MSKKTKVGFVGCGSIARAHLKGYRADPNVTVAAVYDKVCDAAREFAEECGAVTTASIEEMIGEHRLDAVSVCSPPVVHMENCRPFIEAGIPVLCEKPLEINAESAGALADLARGSSTLFMTAFCHRFHPPVIELKKLIESGTLGAPLFFRNIFGGYMDLAGNHRASPAVSGGGSLIDHCCHSVDLFRFLLGNPTRVRAVAGNIVQDLPIEDFGICLLSIDDRQFGEITGSYSLKGCDSLVELYGTKGCATISYFTPNRPELSYVVDGREGRIEVDCSDHPDRFEAEIAHFLDCVRERKQPSCTVDDGLQASLVIDAAYRSVREHHNGIDLPDHEKDRRELT